MPWRFQSDTPIYLQAAEVIRLRILTGEYPPGSHVPSVRDLAQEAAVNPNTMQRALSLLEEQGLLCTQRTAGRTVTECDERIRFLRLKQARSYVTACRRQLARLGFSSEEIQAMLREWNDGAAPDGENDKEE
ncbi:MAG: GntR family transcriptional regulator [Clostridiales bacterium]|nr:GntR family transcriptional regulator [Clostridiales bacterium]